MNRLVFERCIAHEAKRHGIELSTAELEKQYKMYSAIYPVLNGISKLDALCFPFTGYAVSVVCKRPA